DAVYAALDRVEANLEKHAPSGKLEMGAMSPAHAHYFFCREHFKKVERLAKAVEHAVNSPRRAANAPRLPRAKPVKIVVRQHITSNPRFERRRDAVALKHNLADLEPEIVDVPDSPLTALFREVALLEMLTAESMSPGSALLVFRACLPSDAGAVSLLAKAYSNCLGDIAGVSTTNVLSHLTQEEQALKKMFGEVHSQTQSLFLKGINPQQFLTAPSSLILTRRGDGVTGVILMSLESVETEAQAKAHTKELANSIDALEPDAFGPVIQQLIHDKTLTDFRTGVVVSAQPTVEEFRALLLSALPLPTEVAQVLESFES
ncbi:MAG TPA: hypothetical protein VFZ59_16365, partial [Verrucomicrobiae bacterium]|nr:hypothetical protein [Verrucomicrobiae bacterium]